MNLTQFFHKLFLWLLSLFLLGALLVVLGAMVLFWRLSEGRMSMSEVSKGISSVLSMPEQEISIEVESARLTWSDWKNPLGVILYQTEVQTPGGTLILPELEVGLDLTELVLAELVPQEIHLQKPRLRWNPIKTGIPFFPLQSWDSDSQLMEGDFLVPEQFQKLQKITLYDAEIEITNEHSGRVIQTKNVRLDFKRKKGSVFIQASFELLEGEQRSRSSFEGKWQIQEQKGSGFFRLGKIGWPILAEWIPGGRWDLWLDSMVSGSLSIEVDQRLSPYSWNTELDLSSGHIILPGLGKRVFDGAHMEGGWSAKKDRVEITQLKASMKNGLKASGSGYLENPLQSPSGVFALEVQPLSLGSLISDTLKRVSDDITVSLLGKRGEKRFGKLETQVELAPSKKKGTLPDLNNVSGKISFDEVAVEFENKAFPVLSGVFPQMNGELNFEMNSSLEIQKMQSKLNISGGSTVLGDSGESIPIRQVNVSSIWKDSELKIEDFMLELDDSGRLEAEAILKWKKGKFNSLVLDAKSFVVPIDSLSRIWHPDVASETRQWLIEHLSGGKVEEGSLNLHVEKDGAGQMQLKSLNSILQVKDAGVRYYKNLPRGTEVDATVSIDPDQVEIELHQGRIGQLQLNNGRLIFAPLRKGSPVATMVFKSTGPLPKALDLLEHPALAILKEDLLPFTDTSGEVSLRLGMEFPLDHRLEEDFRFVAKAQLEDVILSGMPLNLSMENGRLEVEADSEKIEVSGKGEISGAGIEIDFRKTGKNPSHTKVVAPSSREMAKLIGQLSGLEINGKASANLVLAESAGSNSRIALQLGLEEANVSVPLMGWAKPQGEAAALRGWANIKSGRIESIPFIEVDSQEIKLRSQMILDEKGEFLELQITDLHAPETSVNQMQMFMEEDGAMKIQIEGPKLNLEPLIVTSTGNSPQNHSVIFELNSKSMSLSQSVALSGNLKGRLYDNGTFHAEHKGSLLMDNRTMLNDANFKIQHSGKNPEIQGEGRIGANPLSFSFAPDSKGNSELELESEDAGEMFRFLDLSNAVSGGTLELSTKFQGDNLSYHDSEIHLSNFTLKEAPLLVDVFSLISPTGLLEQLLGDGVFYDEGYGKVTVAGKRYTIHEASAVGFSSGIVFSGWIDLDRNELDINGSVAPAYILSRLVRWIPILGTILTGTDKGGLIALDFRLTGSIDDPEKSSNPLSLAPGILRDVFRFEWLNYFRSDNSTKKED